MNPLPETVLFENVQRSKVTLAFVPPTLTTKFPSLLLLSILQLAKYAFVGSESTVHFPNKKVPAERFALWALHNEYGDKSVNPMGPAFESMKADGDKLLVTLSDASGLHVADGIDNAEVSGDGKTFNIPYAEISGDGKTFVPAKLRILPGGVLEFSSPEVSSPTAARYCFSGWHAGSVFNSAGLPLFPFRASL